MAIAISTDEWAPFSDYDPDDLAGEDLELRAMDQAEAYAAYLEAEARAMAEEDGDDWDDDPGYDVDAA